MTTTAPTLISPLASALGLLVFVSLSVGAQDAKPPETQSLAPVVVTATRTLREALDVPASVDVIDATAIRDAQARINLSESLAKVPGIVVLNRQNYAQDLQISSRGFGARSSFGIRGIRLYVDGVPASFPDGQGQASHFPLDNAQQIEVLRGPFSALYGNSSGGVISLTTDLRPQPNRIEVNGAMGAYATWRTGVNAVGGEGSNAYAIDANHFETDGERGHSGAQRDTLSLRTAFLDSPLGRVRISLNSVAMPDAQDPLGLTRAQLVADPDQAAPLALQFNTRKTVRQNTLGTDVNSRLSDVFSLNTTLWLGDRGVMQYQAIPVATQAPANHPGGVIDFDRTFGGADLRIVAELSSLTTSAGFDVERMNENRRGYENFVGTGAGQQLGVLGNLRRDEHNDVESADPYVQTEYRIGDAWRLDAGVRHSTVRVHSRDRYVVGANGDDSGATSFSATNPTAGVVFRASPRLSTYIAYGRGFETPTLTEMAYRPNNLPGLNTDLAASKSNNWEIGVKAAPSEAVWTTLAVFATRTRNEIVPLSNSGGRATFQNAPRTRRDGVEAAAEWKATPFLSLTGSIAAISARFDSDFSTCGPPPCPVANLRVARGNRIPAVPQRTAYLGLKFRPGWADISIEERAQARLLVDDRNTDAAAGFSLLYLSIAKTIAIGAARPRIFGRIDNALDRIYVGSVIVNESNFRYFEPAQRRTWMIGIDWPLEASKP